MTSRSTQFLVYQMNYESESVNAMILPIPVRGPVRENSLRFIDLKSYSNFFADLASGFPFRSPILTIGCSAASDRGARVGLAVVNVGNYIATFVPSISDFSRLDPRFVLPESTWSRIPQYRDYGFAVFQLSEGSLKPHPMAFEFETAKKTIYFPTVHIHDGEVHDAEEFDHALYLQHAGFDSRVYGYQNSGIPDKSTGLIRSKHVAKHFCDEDRSRGVVDGNLLVHRKIIRGRHPNRDTEITTFGDATTPTLNLRPLFSYTSWVVVVAAVVWFFSRRARLMKLPSQENADDLPADRGKTEQ